MESISTKLISPTYSRAAEIVLVTDLIESFSVHINMRKNNKSVSKIKFLIGVRIESVCLYIPGVLGIYRI